MSYIGNEKEEKETYFFGFRSKNRTPITIFRIKNIRMKNTRAVIVRNRNSARVSLHYDRKPPVTSS